MGLDGEDGEGMRRFPRDAQRFARAIPGAFEKGDATGDEKKLFDPLGEYIEKTARGPQEKCACDGSADFEGIARLTKYFCNISGWNKGKLSEPKNGRINNKFD